MGSPIGLHSVTRHDGGYTFSGASPNPGASVELISIDADSHAVWLIAALTVTTKTGTGVAAIEFHRCTLYDVKGEFVEIGGQVGSTFKVGGNWAQFGSSVTVMAIDPDPPGSMAYAVCGYTDSGDLEWSSFIYPSAFIF